MDRYSINDVIWRYDNGRNPRKGFFRGCHVFAGNNYEEVLKEANSGVHAPYVFIGIKEYGDKNKGFEVISVEDLTRIQLENYHDGIEPSIINLEISPFTVRLVKSFVVVEKDPERKPLDLSEVEVRNFLRDKWIRRKSDSYEKKITYFSKVSKNSMNWKCCSLTSEELFKDWEFIEPVDGSVIIGKLV